MTEDEFDELIDKWHSDEDVTCTLHEYLGLTLDEYKEYVGSLCEDCSNIHPNL